MTVKDIRGRSICPHDNDPDGSFAARFRWWTFAEGLRAAVGGTVFASCRRQVCLTIIGYLYRRRYFDLEGSSRVESLSARGLRRYNLAGTCQTRDQPT